MDTSELTRVSGSVTAAIGSFHSIAGILFLIIKSVVLLLIVFDQDSRGGLYRKYLISLQLSSTITDLICNLYAPILLVNCRLVYADSWLAHQISFTTFGTIETCTFGVVANSYFACGLIPQIIYIAPMGVLCVLYFNIASMPFEEAVIIKSTARKCAKLRNKFTRASIIFKRDPNPASTASALVFTVITTHTVLHSLTILACSPSYRKTLFDCCESRPIAFP
ncbi:hypothetical protein PRIPAC_79538 [Pristionchus pacificus]|uniref:Uncharacterized protein n=1 Tax=Pristionchus pacificus TaxID=54126 RepID=A0A2A6CLH6_PRIPA|nr:hypothetical protein PRIPAC_79538 [Pristionchus pacificus]|eukprot:PDM79095.1 hypothetical protein PRIPAC_31674 [Pristionchus pacificus]